MDIRALYSDIDKQPNILAVIHDFRYTKGGSVGGTTLHLMDIIDNLRESYNFHILYWSADTHKHHITSFFKDKEATKILGEFALNRKEPWNCLYSEHFKQSVTCAIEALRIDAIHVHHIKNMFLNIFDIAKEKDIPLVYSVHDFYAACPSINLIRENNCSCHDSRNRDCVVCSIKKFGIKSIHIHKWQQEFYKSLNSASKIVAPANSTKNILESFFPSLKIQVIEHGYDINTTISRTKKEEMFNIAFVGSITEIKGLDIFLNIVPLVKGSKIRVHLFGTTHRVAVTTDGKNFINHGRYNREELPSLLIKNNIDIVCLPSICAETFSYTLSESFMCNIPVIGLNIGAIAERIRKYDAGWVLPVETTTKELLAFINDLHTNKKEEYLQKIENLKNNQANMQSVANMCNSYSAIYNSLINKDKSQSVCDNHFFEDANSFTLGVEVDKSGREAYRIIRDRITSENLPYKIIIKEIRKFREDFPKSKLRNKIFLKLLWHKLSHKKM